MRNAARRGLIDDPEVWFLHRELRNITEHACNEDTAQMLWTGPTPGRISAK